MNSYSFFKTQFWHLFYCVVALTSLNRPGPYTSSFRLSKLLEARLERQDCGWCQWKILQCTPRGKLNGLTKNQRVSALTCVKWRSNTKIGSFFEMLCPERLVPPQNASMEAFTPQQNTPGSSWHKWNRPGRPRPADTDSVAFRSLGNTSCFCPGHSESNTREAISSPWGHKAPSWPSLSFLHNLKSEGHSIWRTMVWKEHPGEEKTLKQSEKNHRDKEN